MQTESLTVGAEKFLVLGQSESLVQIEKGSAGLKIVKSSPSRNLRFTEQYAKHKLAENEMMEPLLVPKVLSSLNDFKYEMEYIAGVPFGNFIETCDQQELKEPVERIESYLNRSLRFANWSKSNEITFAFRGKLTALKLELDSDSQRNSIFSKLLAYSESELEKLNLPCGWNHGDFSFENILVGQYSHQVFAIDFLDSPFESPFIDLGRIWLDCRFGWWGAGLRANSCFQLNSKVLSGVIMETVSRHNVPITALDVFAALAILRIRPYTTNPLRMAFLKNAAVQILEGKF